LSSVFQLLRPVAALLLWSTLSMANETGVPAAEANPGIPSMGDASPELIFQKQDEPDLVAPDTASYQFYIADLESRLGPYATGLSEQLLGLGTVYQGQGLHEQAIRVFKRGMHLARVNNGLQSAEQIPLLQGMIRSLVASGDFEKADEKQHYLYRMQSEIYEDSAPQMVNAMLQRADWERQAYYLSVGDVAFTRLLTMWQLYGAALNNIANANGNHSTKLLQPLQGLLRTQYMISSFGGKTQAGFVDGGAADTHYVEENRFSAIRVSNYRQGQAVIAALREVYDYNEGELSPQAAQTWVQLGDWHLWSDKQESAELAYQQAWEKLGELEDSEAQQAQFFGKPVLLPDIEGSARDLLPPENISGYAEVSYYINRRGRVKDLETTKLEPVDETDDRPPARLLRRIKHMQYRPIFVDGAAVATETITKRYAY
jgi:hypothetical protein